MFYLLRVTRDSEYLTVDQLALRWQKSRDWLYHNWRSLGLTPIYVGQSLRFEFQDVIDCETRMANPHCQKINQSGFKQEVHNRPAVTKK